jgi:hypothetical protein
MTKRQEHSQQFESKFLSSAKRLETGDALNNMPILKVFQPD